MFPIQFIDGMNESAQPTDNTSLKISGYQSIAIDYTPSLSYSLARLQIFTTWAEISQRIEYGVRIYTDRSGNPSGFILAEAKVIFEPGGSGSAWKQIVLSEPIVLIAQSKYWLSLDSLKAPFALGVTDDGIEVSLRAYTGGRWGESAERIKRKVMIRFYGRVLPVVGL